MPWKRNEDGLLPSRSGSAWGDPLQCELYHSDRLGDAGAVRVPAPGPTGHGFDDRDEYYDVGELRPIRGVDIDPRRDPAHPDGYGVE